MLFRALQMVALCEKQDAVGMSRSEHSLVVVDLYVLAGFDRAHLICGFSISGKDLIEFRQYQEAHGLVGSVVGDLDVVRRNVIHDPGEGRGTNFRLRAGRQEGNG